MIQSPPNDRDRDDDPGHGRSLASRLLAAIDASMVPVPTPDLVAACGDGFRNPKRQCWTRLNQFARWGLVRRIPAARRGRGHVDRWVRAGAVSATTRRPA